MTIRAKPREEDEGLPWGQLMGDGREADRAGLNKEGDNNIVVLVQIGVDGTDAEVVLKHLICSSCGMKVTMA